jgi:hypothetical protein
MSVRTFPHPRPVRRFRPLTSSSRCGCPAPNPFGSRPSARASDRSVARGVRSLRGGRLGRHLIVERCGSYAPPVKERRTRRCNADAFFVSISRRARARLRVRSHECTVFTDAHPLGCTLHGSGFAPPTSRPFGSRTVAGPFFDLAVDRVPARSYRRSPRTTSLVLGSRRARSPPVGALLPRAPTALAWDFRARVGAARRRPRSFRPMSAAHGCCFQRRSPHVSAHVASLCSHTMRELAVSRRNAHFGEPSDRARVLSSPAAASVGVPLMLRRLRAAPVELCPPRSARDRSRDLRSKTRKPRPTPPSRVNGFLGLALARSTFSLRSFLRSDRRPDPTALATSSLSGRDLTRGERELLPCHRPTRHNACPQSSRCGPALLSKRGIPSGVNGSVSETAPRPVVPPRQGDR